MLYETLLGYARRQAMAIISARLDAKLNLHVFNRLLRLPLDYFERNPAGETMYRLGQIHRVRAFLTGKLLVDLARSRHAGAIIAAAVLSERDAGLDRARLRRRRDR